MYVLPLLPSRNGNRNRRTIDHVSVSRKQSDKCRKEFLTVNIPDGRSVKSILLAIPVWTAQSRLAKINQFSMSWRL